MAVIWEDDGRLKGVIRHDTVIDAGKFFGNVPASTMPEMIAITRRKLGFAGAKLKAQTGHHCPIHEKIGPITVDQYWD